MGLTGKTILVTGGAGFIGSWVIDKIALHKPKKIVVVDSFFLGRMENLDEVKNRIGDGLKIHNCDATKHEALENILMKEGQVEAVFNLAVKPLFVSFVDPVSVFSTSVRIATNLLELQRNGLFKTLIHFSSSEAYGSALYVPMDEKHPLKPTTPYGAGKAAADHLVISYFMSYGNDAAIIRPFNNFGPRQNDQTYAGVIPTTIKKILTGEPPLILGDGNQTRDFTYVEDTAEAAVKIYETKETRGRIINIGRGEETSINELVHMIAEIMGYEGEVVYDKARPADVRRHLADITLAKKLIDLKPKFSLRQGLRKTVAWYVDKLSGQR